MVYCPMNQIKNVNPTGHAYYMYIEIFVRYRTFSLVIDFLGYCFVERPTKKRNRNTDKTTIKSKQQL
jgi:hypothetical protein